MPSSAWDQRRRRAADERRAAREEQRRLASSSSSSSRRRGDSALPPDLTARALLGGVAVGTLLAFTNLYFGLQSSWITMASLQAALVGYGLVRLVPPLPAPLARRLARRGQSVHLSPQENAVLQATAVSLGGMPLAAGLIGIIPALSLLEPERDGAAPLRLDTPHLLMWSASMAFFGVCFAAPLRVPFILREALRFPSGTATAQLIGVLHRVPLRREAAPVAVPADQRGDATPARGSGEHERMLDWDERPSEEEEQETQALLDAQSRARADEQRQADDDEAESERQQKELQEGWKPLGWSFAASAAVTLAAYWLPVIFAVPVFDVLVPAHNLARVWGWWLTPSLSYVGQGVIMGLPTTASMFAGALAGWAILSPLATHRGWTDGPPMDADVGGRAWILWVCLAIMTSESLVGLLVLLMPTPNGSRGQSRGSGSGEDDEPPERQTPTTWVLGGLSISTVLAVAFLVLLFGAQGVRVWTVVAGIAIASVLSVLACRSLGATDLNPTNALGKLSQLVFALLSPGNILANLVGGALSEAGAMQASELMQDYKTGHLLHASPRAQFIGTLVGSSAGVVISTLAYKLYERTYVIPGPDMPAPAARLWLNFARLVNAGELPRHVTGFMVVAAALFAVMGALKALAARRAAARLGSRAPVRHVPVWERLAPFLPNGIAFAVGLGLNTPNYSIARLAGGLLAHHYITRTAKRSGARQRSIAPGAASPLPPVGLLVLSAGFVLGEGFASIVALLLREAGAQPLTCWGCRGGCAGGCS